MNCFICRAWLQPAEGSPRRSSTRAPSVRGLSVELAYCRRKAATLSMTEAQFPSPCLGEDYLRLQPRAEVSMQNGSVIRRSRKNHSDIWQFRWWEKTSDGKRIYRRRVIGTVDQIPDREAARKAASLLVPELNATRARSEPPTINGNCVWVTPGEAIQPNTSIRSTCDVGSFRNGANTY